MKRSEPTANREAGTQEYNFDGLIGPTHNYGGLSPGNVASEKSRRRPANPRQAALQGLAKMRLAHSLTGRQALLPPLERPDLAFLRRSGFTGNDARVLEKCARQAPDLLAIAYSASSMWTANAATVRPSIDGADGKLHVTSANLSAQTHRSLEPEATSPLLARLFSGIPGAILHPNLPQGNLFGDEGAANHMRLAPEHGAPGLHVFVYGRSVAGGLALPHRHPARQTLEASQAVARLHGLDGGRALFLQQNPKAIDAGAFHNDVIAVNHLGFLLVHEKAFAGGKRDIEILQKAYRQATGKTLSVCEVPARKISLATAVETYLFNSQFLDRQAGGVCLLAARECRANAKVRAFLENTLLPGDNPVSEVRYVDLRQSMRNGGGPACLRLRVALTPSEAKGVHAGVLLHEERLQRLEVLVSRHYRDRLTFSDLADPRLLLESRECLDELSGILDLPQLYRFQA